MCRINDDAMQKKLLVEGNKLTLTKALFLTQLSWMPLPYYQMMPVHSKYTESSQQPQLKARSHVTDVLEQDTHRVPASSG